MKSKPLLTWTFFISMIAIGIGIELYWNNNRIIREYIPISYKASSLDSAFGHIKPEKRSYYDEIYEYRHKLVLKASEDNPNYQELDAIGVLEIDYPLSEKKSDGCRYMDYWISVPDRPRSTAEEAQRDALNYDKPVLAHITGKLCPASSNNYKLNITTYYEFVAGTTGYQKLTSTGLCRVRTGQGGCDPKQLHDDYILLLWSSK